VQSKQGLPGCAARALPATDTDQDGVLKFYRFLAASHMKGAAHGAMHVNSLGLFTCS